MIGSESESVMVRWALRILSCNKEVQARLQAELDAVCGPGVDVTWDKREKLPYTMATIKEIMRFADIAPTGQSYISVQNINYLDNKIRIDAQDCV